MAEYLVKAQQPPDAGWSAERTGIYEADTELAAIARAWADGLRGTVMVAYKQKPRRERRWSPVARTVSQWR